MPRKALSKTVTVDNLTFKPAPGRQRTGPQGEERYWQARRYLGLDANGKPQRVTVWTGWSRRDQLAAIAASLVPTGSGELQPAATPGLATLAELQAGDVQTMLRAWRGDRAEDPDLSPRTKAMNKTTVDHMRRVLRGKFAISTVRQTLVALGAAWHWARRRNIVDRDLDLSDAYRRLNAALKRGEDTGERDRMIPEEDAVWAILDVIDGDAPRWAGVAFRLYLLTGARPGELAALTWRDLDAEAGEIRVTHGKTGARNIPADPRLLAEILAARPAAARDGDRVLPPSARSGLARYLDRASEAAGVPRITPYAMRRYAVRSLIRAGVPIKVAAEIMGHSPLVMLRSYEQVTETDKAQAVRRAALGVRPAPEHAENAGKVVALRRG
jgi:integrase